ncbi:MAG: cyclic nucleotide-binding domain-containing protein [Deltaproteobacteria bacterium]|nr:cyclic nucleotide-binding domain-containing protein [Deltaproteobacteria bacterium]
MTEPTAPAPRPPTPRELRKNLSVLRKVVLKNPLDLDARLRIARTYRLLDKPADAVEHYRSVARYLANAGHPVLAIAVVKELLQVAPDHQESLLMLARLYARTRAPAEPGRIAVPIPEQGTDAAAAGLLRHWPQSHTGLWRALQEADSVLKSVSLAPGTRPGPAFAALLGEQARDTPPMPMPAVDRPISLDDADVLEERVAGPGVPAPPLEDESPTSPLRPAPAAGPAPPPQDTDPEGVETVSADEIAEVQDDSGDASPMPPLPDVPDHPIPLPSIPLFSSLDQDGFVTLTRALVHKTVAAGEYVWKDGDDAFFLVVLAAGEAVIYRGEGAHRVEMHRLAPGDVAGVFALVADRRRQASMQAVTDIAYFELHRSVVEKLARDNKALQEALQGFFRERVIGAVLAMLPLVRDLDVAARQDVAARFRIKRYQEGDELFYAGTETSGLWVVLEGVVGVGTERADGEFETRQMLPPGHFVASLAQPKGAATELGALARGDVTTAVLNHKAIVEVMTAYPALRGIGEALDPAGFLLSPNVAAGSAQLPADLSPAFLQGSGARTGGHT